MSRKKNHEQETTLESNPSEGLATMSDIAETNGTPRKRKESKQGGYRCLVRQSENDEWITVAQTRTKGQMAKWYSMSYTLVHKTYNQVSFERYYVLGSDLKPLVK